MSNTNKIFIGIVLIVAAGLAIWALSGSPAKAPTPATEEKPAVLGNTVATSTLAIGENATLNGVNVNVLGLVEDSRCAVDVQCIQAGTVRVKVSVAGTETVLTLGQAKQVGDISITLTGVIPAERKSGQTLQPSDYRFIFSVETAFGGKG